VRRSSPRRRTSPWGDPPRRRELLRALPKTDLHVHLDGSLRPSTLLDLAEQKKVALPFRTPRDLSRAFSRLASGVSLPEYLKAFDWTLSVLQDKASLERVAFELAEDAHAESVRYMEVRYCPALHTRKRLSMEETVEAVRTGLRRAERAYGIRTGTIVCGIRHLSPRLSVRLADLAAAYYGKGVVGFDLAGAERDYPAKAHRRAFDRVRKHHVNITVHAGEAFGAASIDQALRYCGAHRIGHGTRLREDPAVLAYVRDHRIPLEMCLVSNVQTGAVRSMSAHPFRRYLQAGLRVTVNTDNRLVSSTTMTEELERAVTAFRLGPADIRYVLLNGFKSAFLPYEEKGALLRAALADMDRLFEEAGVGAGEASRELL
jgi:adenosine deaminase